MLDLRRLREVMEGEEHGRLWLDRKSNGDALARLVKGPTDPQAKVMGSATAPDIVEALYLLQEKVCGKDEAVSVDTFLDEIGGKFNSWLIEEYSVELSGEQCPFGWSIKYVDHASDLWGNRVMVGVSVMDALNNFVTLIQKREDLLLVTQEAVSSKVCWAIPPPITDKFILVARGEIERATNKVYNLAVEAGREEMVKVWLDARYLTVVA